MRRINVQKIPMRQKTYKFLFLTKLFVLLFYTGCGAAIEMDENTSGMEPTAVFSEEPGRELAQKPEEDSPFVPKVTKSYKASWEDLVMYSEGYYCIYNGSFYGFMTEKGEEITPFIYERAFPFSEGLACVCLDGKYGYIGTDGETEIPFIYDQACPFSEGLAYFCIGEEYGFMDREGQVVLRPECDSVSSFHEGYAYFSVDGGYGYMDKTGKIVTEPVYDDAGYFYNGAAAVRKGGKYGLIGPGGVEILPAEYDQIDIDTYIYAEQDGLVYCFDKEGKLYLEEAWDYIRFKDGLFEVQRDSMMGLLDEDGNVILEPKYDVVSSIPEKKLVIVKNDGLYGVLDYDGNIKVPFVYDWIRYDDGITDGGLRIECRRPSESDSESAVKWSYGYLSGGDFSEKIPPVYDYMSYFAEGRAIVGQDGKYGVILEDGTLEYSLIYDNARVFSDGSLMLHTADLMELYDRDGNLIHRNAYDSITECESCYEIKKSGKCGFLDKKGNVIVPMVYDYASNYSVYGTRYIYLLRKYGEGNNRLLLKTAEDTEDTPQKALLQNRITPRAKPYWQWVTETDEGPINRHFCKLYRLEGTETLVLYSYIEPYTLQIFPLSDSGFYTLLEEGVVELIKGAECGGSSGGTHICFWYDTEEGKNLPGTYDTCGGFAGHLYGGSVYKLQGGEAVKSTSFYYIWSTARNYTAEELQSQAELFYDENDQPYTAESVAEAEYVTVYLVDDELITRDNYNRVRNRYQYVTALGN